jgi:hypothetical protein
LVPNKRQSIAPVFGQLAGSEPAGIPFTLAAHTLLVSKELCHVARATWSAVLSGLRKWVMIWTSFPKMFTKRVASGRAPRTVQEVPPVLVGRQI